MQELGDVMSQNPTITVEERLAALEGAEEARRALARYADAVDAQDLAALDRLLADGVVLDVGESIEGRTAVRAFFEKAFADDPTEKSHFITNVQTKWMGDGRTMVSAYFLFTAADDTQSIIGWGTYENEIVVDQGPGVFSRIGLRIRRTADVREGWTLADL
jgi:ketosteroid isomerase-like protein